MKTSLLATFAFAVFAAPLFAEPPTPSDDLRKTLSAAAKEKKLAFVLMGRPACGNCNAAKAMIKDGRVQVTSAEFVMADLLVDDPRTEAEFSRKFKKEQFGNTLPYVVIADSSGKALASTSGGHSADEWNKLIAEAKAKAGAKPAAAGGAKENWPFKTPAK